MSQDCSCDKCVSCCSQGNPGWFMPGEAEVAARYLVMTFEESKAKYLILDYWVGEWTEGFDILAPIKTIAKDTGPYSGIMNEAIERARATPGERAPWAYPTHKGRCVFLDGNNRCQIHAVKPYECREATHDDDQPNWRRKIVAAWARFYRKQKKSLEVS